MKLHLDLDNLKGGNVNLTGPRNDYRLVVPNEVIWYVHILPKRGYIIERPKP